MRGKKKIREDFTKLFIKGNADEDLVIEPNDAIYIPIASLKNVYVMGAVLAPRSIEYREGITIMEAILEAGGFTAFAKPNETIIHRREKDKDVSLTVKMKQLMSEGDLTQNVALKPGDYIVVKEGMF
jgi:polysaccharide export outer membrane protein